MKIVGKLGGNGDSTKKDVMKIVERSEADIVRIFDESARGKNVDIITKGVKKTRGLREGCSFLSGEIGYKVDNEAFKKLRFFVKYYFSSRGPAAISSTSPGFLPNAEIEEAFYDLMRGSSVVPKAYRLPTARNMLLLEHAGDMTLEEKIFRIERDKEGKEKEVYMEDEQERYELVKKAIDVFVEFDSYSSILDADQLIAHDKMLKWLKRNRGKEMLESAKRHIRTIVGKRFDESKIEEVLYNYMPLIRVKEATRRKLVHGDGGAQNVIGPGKNEKGEEIIWTPKNIKLVDLANFGFGSPLYVQGQLLTSPKMNFGYAIWNDAIGYYKSKETNKQIETMGLVEDERRIFELRVGELVPIRIGKRKKPSLTENIMKQAYTQFYTGVADESFERITRMIYGRTNFTKEEYEAWLGRRPALKGSELEMARNVQIALGYVINNWNAFDFDAYCPNSLNRLKGLRKNFFEEGLLSREYLESIKAREDKRIDIEVPSSDVDELKNMPA